MSATLAEVLRRFGPEYLRSHRLSPVQARAWRAIVACRTPALGGQRLCCNTCGAEQWRWHSCRNRHCPQCQSRQRDAWRRARLAELLDVPYCHLVFTLPHELNALAAVHARWVYDTLMRCTAQTLSEFAANARWLGGTGAFTLVLHSWTQELGRHLHVHALMACGALTQGVDGSARWLVPRHGARFLFPVQALSKVFRGKFLAALHAAEQTAALSRDPATCAEQRLERTRTLRRHDWVVYAKTPLAGAAAVLDYLSRYTHRTAVGNERIVALDGQGVRLRVRDRQHDGKHAGAKRSVLIDGVTFIERFLHHVLPTGFKRIRHYGLLAPTAKAQRLAAARAALAMPPTNPRACEDAAAFMRRVASFDIDRCPLCRTGRLLLVQSLVPLGTATPAPDANIACRGPP